MVRLLLVVVLVSFGVLLAMKPLLNIAPSSLDEAVEVATGLGAKLACSGRYISGLDEARMKEDLASYSPAFSLVDIRYDNSHRSAHADLLDLAPVTASFRQGLGCTLDLPGTERLDAIEVTALTDSQQPWPAGSGAGPVDAQVQQAVDMLLGLDNNQGYQTRALVVVRAGELVAEAYGKGFAPDTPLLGWSMGKSLTAMLLGGLERDGLVNVEQRNLFTSWRADERRDISLENMLQMASGLEFDEAYTPGSDATYMLSAAESAASVALDKPLIQPPGEHFSYSSGTTNMLALYFQQQLGGTTQLAVDYLYKRLLGPLHMVNTLVEPDPSGVFVGSSYVYASGRDWARLGQLMINGGELGGYRLLSEDWVKRAQTPNHSGNEPRYGYQFWLNSGAEELRWPDLPADAYAMLGNRSQIVMIIPSLDTVIVRLGWSASEYPTSRKLATLLP
jgi:CubicO group peptidase (beta-lactamase class C family)